MSSRSKSPLRIRRSRLQPDTPHPKGSTRSYRRRSPYAEQSGLRVYQLFGLLLASGTALAVYWHKQVYGSYSLLHASLSLFLVLNMFVSTLEWTLFWQRENICARAVALHRAYDKLVPSEARAAGRDYFLWSVRDAGWLGAWTDAWVVYTLFDASYVNDESFGFWIDCSNGLLTFWPSLVMLLVSSGVPLPSVVTPRMLGGMSLCLFWTMWWGTVVYAWSFRYHRRGKTLGMPNTFLFVLLTNGCWFVWPLLGMYCSWRMILENSLAVFL